MNQSLSWLAVLAIGAFAVACTPLVGLFPASAPTPDPGQVYRPALQGWAQSQLDSAGPLPHYTIQAELSPSGDWLGGTMSAAIPNNSSDVWPNLVFRLYPNMPHYGGAMQVTQLQVNGEAAAAELVADGAALRVTLPEPLKPGQSAAMTLAFKVNLPQHTDGYTLFGWEDGILSLPGFYPTLAVYDETLRSVSGGWAIEVPPPFADVLFNPVAFYDLAFTAPANLTLVTSGNTLQTSAEADGRQTWHIGGGPLRDMTILASDRWAAASDTAAGATVTSYYPATAGAAGRAALFHAAAALRLYSDLYGRYPYTEFDVVAAPLGVRGMEYSGLVTIGEDLYGPHRDQLAFLVAHETAHQWWYAQVGSDPMAHPWLDEGPAEYAAFDYYRGVYGQSAAEELLSARWQTPYAVAAARGIDGPVDQAASAMSDANYELLTYAKAALFFDALRDQSGDETYRHVMQAYMDTYRWQIATPQHFFGLAQTLAEANLNPLIEDWLR